MTARLEHVNITVSDPAATTQWMSRVFGWHIRWQGDAINDGHTIHVGSDDTYIAVYSGPTQQQPEATKYERAGGLNHIAVTVPDLDATEELVKAAGFQPRSHADYEPGRRFYFEDNDGIEYEVVSYA